MTLWKAMSPSWSIKFVQVILTAGELMALSFGLETHGLQRMNPSEFADPLNVLLTVRLKMERLER